MKRVLLMLAAVIVVMAGCKKDDDLPNYTFYKPQPLNKGKIMYGSMCVSCRLNALLGADSNDFVIEGFQEWRGRNGESDYDCIYDRNWRDSMVSMNIGYKHYSSIDVNDKSLNCSVIARLSPRGFYHPENIRAWADTMKRIFPDNPNEMIRGQIFKPAPGKNAMVKACYTVGRWGGVVMYIGSPLTGWNPYESWSNGRDRSTVETYRNYNRYTERYGVLEQYMCDWGPLSDWE